MGDGGPFNRQLYMHFLYNELEINIDENEDPAVGINILINKHHDRSG